MGNPWEDASDLRFPWKPLEWIKIISVTSHFGDWFFMIGSMRKTSEKSEVWERYAFPEHQHRTGLWCNDRGMGFLDEKVKDLLCGRIRLVSKSSYGFITIQQNTIVAGARGIQIIGIGKIIGKEAAAVKGVFRSGYGCSVRPGICQCNSCYVTINNSMCIALRTREKDGVFLKLDSRASRAIFAEQR